MSEKGPNRMSEQEFNRRLQELIREIGAAPNNTKVQTIEQAVEKMRQSLDYLRLLVKYMAFDLEATRRERDELKKRLLEDDEQDMQD